MAIRTLRTRALIVGAGAGLSAALARALTCTPASPSASRRANHGQARRRMRGHRRRRLPLRRDRSPRPVAALFQPTSAAAGGDPDVVVYNASGRARGDVRDPGARRRARRHRRQRLRRLPRRAGGRQAHAAAPAGAPCCSPAPPPASKGIRAPPPSPWASSRLRGLAQSMARELGPRGIHVAHVDHRRRHPQRHPA